MGPEETSTTKRVSIPYGKGKVDNRTGIEKQGAWVSIPYGKGKVKRC